MDREFRESIVNRSIGRRLHGLLSAPNFQQPNVHTLTLRLCGDAALTSRPSGAPVEPPLGAKTLALLAYLAIEPGAHRREQVTALLWGDSPEERARGSLRQALT